MSAVLFIAKDELRLMRRNSVAVVALAMLVLLALTAVVTAASSQQNIADQRAGYQEKANREFNDQPDRHPHRMVHFGHFVFRPLGPLAAFDPGVDSFTGSAMFIEGHRQNTANFGDVRQSSLLIRFGQLTPAFVLQTLVPLLLIFLGYAMDARERERGTIRQLAVQGVSIRQMVGGKLLALGVVALLALLPALLSFAYAVGTPDASSAVMLMIASGYVIWLALWVLIVTLVSTLVLRSRDALLALLALWTVSVVLLPRLAPDLAGYAHPLSTRLESDIAIQNDLRRLGDSHNPDDPFFAAFKAKTLKTYGVTRVEDLPVNYKGLLAVEGEKLTSGLFDRYGVRSFDQQAAQSAAMDCFGIISPMIALRRLSIAAAGTDLQGHRRFLDQAEAYRFALVQRLNQLEADAVSYADDVNDSADPAVDRRRRISSENWKAMPVFRFQPLTPEKMMGAAMPGLVVLITWLAAAGIALTVVTRERGRGLVL